MKCRYKYCPYGGQVEKEEAVKINNKYYHKDCYQNQQHWKKFMELYDKYVVPRTKEGFQIIGKAIKQLLVDKNQPIEYLLYILCQIIREKKSLNSIFGLHYYINDYKYQKGYKNILISRQPKIDVNKVKTEEETKMEYKEQKTSLWGDVLGIGG